MLAGSDDTIVAAATPAGRGAIAVVRLSGARALDIGAQVVAPWPVTERRATLCDLRDPVDASLIDRGVVTVYRAPRSYTGEDLVEFSTHGGRIVPTVLAGVLLRAGAREALPGEFTRRALLNGKMDLTQAEAVGDLVDARTDAMRRASLYQVSGGLSRTIAKLRDSVLDLEAMLAYDIDFPEEDDGPIARTRVSAAAREVVGALDLLMRSANLARVVRDGASVVIAGAPNVGKSSLFNALLGQNRAIVTAEPGTTRDAIEQLVETAGWPLRLVDTAGLRDGADLVERLGIEVSERHARAADVVLVCGDSLPALADARQRIASLTGAPLILVRTKADLPEFGDEVAAGDAVVSVSARSSQGLDVLLQAIVGTLQEHCGSLSDMTPLLSHARQQLAVERALSELGAFQAAWENDSLPAPVSAVHVRSAAVALDEIIGAVGVDDVLDRVFARFCVGK